MNQQYLFSQLKIWLFLVLFISIQSYHSIKSLHRIKNEISRSISYPTTHRRWIRSIHLTPRMDNTLNSNHNSDGEDDISLQQTDQIKSKIDNDFFHVSVPAFFSLAAEPLVTLVDSSYVGQLGAVNQAGMGIASSAQFSVSKLYNDPLLKTTTSLVAGKSGGDLQAAVSTAISSAALIGSVQGLVFMLFSGHIMNIMGVSTSSSMRIPSMSYLRWRAIGIPASTVLLVTNGIFRGRGDTKTPLYCTLGGNLVNILLDPILIFKLNMGCGGAGAALSISQWVAAGPLLYLLHKSIPFNIFKQDTTRLGYAFTNYFKAGMLIFLRTIAKISAYTVTASAAARLGPIPMAAYTLTFNLGFTAAQLCESVAIAAQAFLARDMPFDTLKKQIAARHTILRSLQIGLIISFGLVSTTIWNLDNLLKSMTSSPEVRIAAQSVIPIVLFAQVIKGISSSTGSILLGGCDWLWSTLSMKLAAIICVSLIVTLPPSLQSIWIALASFMSTQVMVAALRIASGTGPWKMLFKAVTLSIPFQNREISKPSSAFGVDDSKVDDIDYGVSLT